MPEWIAISANQHAEYTHLPREGFAFAANQPVTGLLLAELAKLLPHYSLGFIKQGEQYYPVALLSLDGKHNLYVHSDGRWLCNYVPASLRGFPFTLLNTEAGQKALCIDSAYLTKDAGEPIFDKDGKLDEKVSKLFDFLQQCEQNRQVTIASTQKLAEAGVIESWPLTLDREEGQEPLKFEGLYRVSEKALSALDADTYNTLRGGPMALAYAQLFSMSQLNQLIERAAFHHKQKGANKPMMDLEAFFDQSDEDISFNFDS